MRMRAWMLAVMAVVMAACAPPGKTLSVGIAQVSAAAASQGAMGADGFSEDTQWNITGKFWREDPPAWAKEVPGLLRAYQETKPPLRNTDHEALGVHIYRYGDKVAMVGLSLLIERMAPEHGARSLATIKAVTAAASGHPEAAAWLDEAFAESEKLQAQYAKQDHPAAASGPAQYVPMVQKVFGEVRVAAYTGDVAAVFILPN